MEGQYKPFDICILCALHEEASAVIDEFSTRCGITFTQAFRASNQLEYFHSTIQNRRGESLTIFITWLSEVGPIRTALDLKLLFQEINPRFVAMTGVCAGDRRKVRLGDLIVATSSYHLEEGKIIAGADAQPVHQPALRIVDVRELVKQYVQGFNEWREPLRDLKLKRGKRVSNEPACHIGVMASSMAVHADNPFPALTAKYHRKTIGLDMETATFYAVLRDLPLLHGLTVKGVSDYGDRHKTDHYRTYAMQASAVYMLHFIQEYVTEETMPRRESGSLPVFTVRAQRDLFFTGRAELLQSLRQNLTPGSVTAITQAISGMGGIGKTHTAIEYAYRFRSSYTAVLWLAADSWENVLSGCFTLATELGLPEEKEADRVLIVVQHWLLQHSGWLLILDNVERVQEILPRLLPPGYQGCVLLTTRIQHVEPFAQTQVMDLLPETEGVLFLLRRTALLAPTADLVQTTAVQHKGAREIWELLGGLPLALDQAGAYILETGCTLAAYCEQYESRRSALLARRGWRFVGHEASVAATLSLAVEQVEAHAPLAAEILRICSLLDGKAIPEELFSEGTEPLALPVQPDLSIDETFGMLQNYSLIQRDSERKMLSIHRLVQIVLQNEMEEKAKQHRAERVILSVNQIFPHVEYATWAHSERLLPQALNAVAYARSYELTSPKIGRLLYEAGSYLCARARYQEAELLYRQALWIKEQNLGAKHPEVAAILNNLGNLYREQSKYAEAEAFYLRSLEIRGQLLGLEHPEVAASLSNLAEIYREQGKYTEAEPVALRALRIREQLLKPDHPDVATSLNNLAILYREQGRYTEAEPLYRRALNIWEQQLGPTHPDVAYPVNGLANLYRGQGKYAEAEPLYERALAIRKQHLGLEHPLVAESFNNLAEIYREQGKYTEAEPLYQQARKLYERQWEPNHPDTAHVLNNLADLYYAQNRYAEAEPLFQRARDIFERHFGLDHPWVSYSLTGLANLYRERNEYGQAASLYQRALSIREHALVPLHPDTADTLFGFAALRVSQGNYLEAVSMYRRALKIRRHVFGSQHPKTIEVRDELRTVLQTLGRDEKASQLEVEQLEQEDLEREA